MVSHFQKGKLKFCESNIMFTAEKTKKNTSLLSHSCNLFSPLQRYSTALASIYIYLSVNRLSIRYNMFLQAQNYGQEMSSKSVSKTNENGPQGPYVCLFIYFDKICLFQLENFKYIINFLKKFKDFYQIWKHAKKLPNHF